ncbi:DUF6286 domain-containing protein [Streptomyces sp. NPDC001935]
MVRSSHSGHPGCRGRTHSGRRSAGGRGRRAGGTPRGCLAPTPGRRTGHSPPGRRVGAHGSRRGRRHRCLADLPGPHSRPASLAALRSPTPELRASLDRDGAAVLLRDAAMRVPGVAKARIRVRRHRLQALADVRFRDSQQIKAGLIAVLGEERDRLALARPPRIVVRVRRRAD